jgi:hypothetical protein
MSSSIKKILILILITSLLVVSTIQSTMATVQTTSILQSSGTISYPSPSPTPTPSPSPTPTPTPNGVSASSWVVIGDDYLVFQGNSNGQPNGVPSSTWTSSRLAKFTQYHCHVARLGFAFAGISGTTCSYYNYAKMSQTLDLLGSVGIKGVLLLQNDEAFGGYFGSTAMVNNWVQVANDFKGDSRVVAFSLFGEPAGYTWASSGPVGAINSAAKAHQFLAYLIDQIRAVDPSRTIIYPTFDWMGFSEYDHDYGFGSSSVRTQFMNDITSAGITAKGNIVYDILHPYYWEDSPSMDPTSSPVSSAQWYGDNIIAPMASLFGAGNCWIGETFPWASSTRETSPAGQRYTDSDQIAFETEIINVCCTHNVGLQLWCYFSRQADYGYTSYDTALQNSIY